MAGFYKQTHWQSGAVFFIRFSCTQFDKLETICMPITRHFNFLRSENKEEVKCGPIQTVYHCNGYSSCFESPETLLGDLHVLYISDCRC